MKTLLFYLLTFLTFGVASAQTTLETVKKSRVVKNEITLRVKGGNAIDFFIDKATSAKTLDSINYFEVKDSEFRVNIDFVNPLRYRITSENKEVDDELYKASNEYLSNAISLLQLIGSAQKAGVSAALRGVAAVDAKKAETYVFEDPQIAELYIMVKLWNANFLKNKASLLESMQKLKFEASRETIFKKVNATFTTLINIATIVSITDELKKNEKEWGEIDSEIATLDKRFDSLNINFASLTIGDANLKNIITFRLNALKKEIDDFEKSIGDIKTKYNAIKKLFEDLSTRKSSDKEFLLVSVSNLRPSKRVELKIYLQEVTFDINDKTVELGDKKEFVLHIKKYAFFIPVVSSGILYSNLTFNRFGTSTDSLGRTVVSQSSEDKKEVVTGAYLNLFFNTKGEHQPFLQIGAGPTSDKPILFLGGGLSLGARLNISAGAVFTWFPKLKDLSIGDEVKGTADIDNATHYEFDTTPKFYIGLNINLTN